MGGAPSKKASERERGAEVNKIQTKAVKKKQLVSNDDTSGAR
jgi:hypothetical protein